MNFFIYFFRLCINIKNQKSKKLKMGYLFFIDLLDSPEIVLLLSLSFRFLKKYFSRQILTSLTFTPPPKIIEFKKSKKCIWQLSLFRWYLYIYLFFHIISITFTSDVHMKYEFFEPVWWCYFRYPNQKSLDIFNGYYLF